MIMSLQLP